MYVYTHSLITKVTVQNSSNFQEAPFSQPIFNSNFT